WINTASDLRLRVFFPPIRCGGCCSASGNLHRLDLEGRLLGMFHLNDRLLEKLIDGSASGGEVTRIKRHAESCRACARRLEEWRDNYREVDEHFPDLAHEAGPAATVTPGGLVLLPTDDIQERNWAPDLTTLLWVAAVILALVVGYGASRLRQPNEGMAVATREGRGTPPAPQRRDGIAAGATAAPARDSSPAVAL